MDEMLVTIGGAALVLIEFVAIAYVVAYKERSTSAFAWSLAIVFLPLLGILLLLVFGRERLPRRVERRGRHADRLRIRPRDSERRAERRWADVEHVATSLGSTPARPGNAVTLLPDGAAAFAAIRRAVEEARRHIHVEEYIFRNDRLGGELLRLLIEKARAGVQVRLLVDAIGTTGPRRLFRELERAGGRGAVSMPISPFARLFAPNHRNHRKIIVCDGRVGFLGGMNVGDEYFGLGFRSRYWADLHLRIEGPAVLDLQEVFVRDWDFAMDETPDEADAFPEIGRSGDALVQIVASGPDEPVNSVREVIFTALARARRRILVSSPYLVPDAGLRDALRNAALRGVEVVLLTQGRPPENWLTHHCSRFYWDRWLALGMRIFEYQRGILHSKAVVVDDDWATIGSANVDNRSLQLNFEVQALLDQPETVGPVCEHFASVLACSREVTGREFARRSLALRATESVVRLLAPLL
jgi:cardiolipin synthase A/B